MARKPKQQALADPDTGVDLDAGPERDDELHALWGELCEAQDATKAARDKEAEIKSRAAEELHAKGIDHYKADGADLWLEPGPEKVKAKRPSERKKGKITQATVGEVD